MRFFTRPRLKYEIQHGETADFSGRRVCLFSHYDKDARLDPHVVHYLRALAAAGLSVVLISSNMDLSAESLDLAKTICAAVILRENRGWDFAGWALGMRVLPGVYDADEIVIANDSVYGPMHPLTEMFEAMKKWPWDLWGVTESFEVDRHLQSYFVVFRKRAIAAPAFRQFWEGVRPLDNKQDVIISYETMLTKRLSVGGLQAAAYVQHFGEYLWRNPTLHHWRRSLEHKSPFLKVQLLRDNPLGIDISGWDEMVASRGYDPGMIRRHLDRVR